MLPPRHNERAEGGCRDQTSRGAKSLVSGAGAYFLTEREASLVVGANPGGLQKLDLDERNASVAQNAAVTQI